MEQNSNRKPYVRPVEANWWTKKNFYIKYMLREGTCLLVLLFALEMLAYYISLTTAAEEDLFAKAQKFAGFFSHPVTILVNLVVLAAVLFHAFTWFPLMPKALRVIVKDQKSGLYKLLDGKLVVYALFGLMGLCTIAGAICFFVLG